MSRPLHVWKVEVRSIPVIKLGKATRKKRLAYFVNSPASDVPIIAGGRLLKPGCMEVPVPDIDWQPKTAAAAEKDREKLERYLNQRAVFDSRKTK